MNASITQRSIIPSRCDSTIVMTRGSKKLSNGGMSKSESISKDIALIEFLGVYSGTQEEGSSSTMPPFKWKKHRCFFAGRPNVRRREKV